MDNTVQDASHLKPDDGGLIAELDVKEYLETREKNAREDRAFAFKSRVLDRAREVTNRSYEHEIRVLRKGLHDLTAKTPNFRNTAHPSIAGNRHRTSHHSQAQPSRLPPLHSRSESKHIRSTSLPALYQTPVVNVMMPPGQMTSRNSDPLIPALGRLSSIESPTSEIQIDPGLAYQNVARKPDAEERRVHCNSEEKLSGHKCNNDGKVCDRQHSESDRNTTRRAKKRKPLPPLKQNPELWKNSTKNYMRRSKYVQNTLSNLYKQRSKDVRFPMEPQRPNFIIQREYVGQEAITIHTSLNYQQPPSNEEKWPVQSASVRT